MEASKTFLGSQAILKKEKLKQVNGCVAGPSKLPEVGKGLGKTFKSFQTAAKVRS